MKQPTKYLTFNDKTEEIEKILTKLGYELRDCRNYWQCNALYRDGDNKTALQIWKNSGVWRDFVKQTTYLPFEKLIQLTCKQDYLEAENMIKDFKSGSSSESDICFVNLSNYQDTEIDIFFDHKEIKTLLPHYNFYNEKGISSSVLKEYHSGFSSSGKMNGRFVFPVYDENSRIIGMTGRHLLWNKSSKFPKWKHIGRKNNWVYPVFLPNNNENLFFKDIELKKEIILVESIGDSLALTEQGIRNHLVIFGLDLSPKQLSFLNSLSVNKIIIATNNDSNKQINRGRESAIKIFLKLIKHFDIPMVEIKLPIKNDFGEMLENDISVEKWLNKKIIRFNQIKYIIKYLQKQNSSQKLIKILKEHLEELNCESNFICK